ncbi:hypothetical protein BGZ52_013079, partial [Haplosporangium bisporale]
MKLTTTLVALAAVAVVQALPIERDFDISQENTPRWQKRNDAEAAWPNGPTDLDSVKTD